MPSDEELKLIRIAEKVVKPAKNDSWAKLDLALLLFDFKMKCAQIGYLKSIDFNIKSDLKTAKKILRRYPDFTTYRPTPPIDFYEQDQNQLYDLVNFNEPKLKSWQYCWTNQYGKRGCRIYFGNNPEKVNQRQLRGAFRSKTKITLKKITQEQTNDSK